MTLDIMLSHLLFLNMILLRKPRPKILYLHGKDEETKYPGGGIIYSTLKKYLDIDYLGYSSDPIEGWLLAEEGSQLLVIVLINRRDVGIRHTNGSREQADVVEHIGIVLADELRVEATHRQTCDGTGI